ncbi:MAG TPA: recombination mediator RecR [Phycisphaerales bacterium]|nr:recombination mediator RecR [Phycisphaerales bacterium]
MKRPGPKSNANPEPVERLIDEFARLPGIGRRSAERMAFHVLKSSSDDALRLARAVEDVKKHVKACSICFNLTDVDPCRICSNANRDASIVLVVEQPKDLIGLEQTGMFNGVYHVLAGRIDPLNGVEPRHLTIDALLERLDHAEHNARGVAVKEVILGTNPNLEGDSTALYLGEQLSNRGVKVTRLARGLPTGSQLEYASKAVLADAIQGRQQMGQTPVE